MPAYPNLNPNKKQEQQVYSGETSYPTYVVKIKEINLRSRRVLPNNQPSSPIEELEYEKEDSVSQSNSPPFPERLIHPSQHTPKETKILSELKNLCVKIPLLQSIMDVPIYNKLIKEKWEEKEGHPYH